MAKTEKLINVDPEILGGVPVFMGTRVPIQALLDYLMGGETLEVFLDHFPSVTRDQALGFIQDAGMEYAERHGSAVA
jgi:uncharacterized protein (DUF433 family)